MSQFIEFLEGIANTSPLTPLQKQLFKEKVMAPFSNLDTTDTDTLPPTHLPPNMAKTGNILILNDGNIAIKQSTSIKCITTTEITNIANENIIRVYDVEKMMEGLLEGFDLFGNPIIYHTDGVNEQLKRAIISDKGSLQNGAMVYTRQLSGVILFQIDEDVANTFDLAGYINTFLTNIKTVWEAVHDPKDATLFIKICPDHTVLSLSDFEDLLAGAVDDVAQEVIINSKVWFLYDDRQLIDFSVVQPNTQQSTIQMIENYNVRILGNTQGVNPITQCAKHTDRFVHILVGNGKNSEMTTASYIDTTNSTGYMHIVKNGSEAAHEFGHLCGLADRYLECIVKNSTDFEELQEFVYKRTYGFPTPSPLLKRFNIPLAFREPNKKENYNAGENLMANKSKKSLTDYQLSFVFGQSSGNNYKKLWEPTPLKVNLHGTQADLSGIESLEIKYVPDFLFPENHLFKGFQICANDGSHVSNVPKQQSLLNHWFKVSIPINEDGDFGMTSIRTGQENTNASLTSNNDFKFPQKTFALIKKIQSQRIGWQESTGWRTPFVLFTKLKTKRVHDATFDVSTVNPNYIFCCNTKGDINQYSSFLNTGSIPRLVVTWAILERMI